jgi:aryl-alcohol dehydrogenase-like predicted oxidoreductase
MEQRTLGWTDLELTRIGLGTWAIGGGDWAFAWGPQDDERSIEAIHGALDRGVNWIDTAAVYGLGHSEEVVGKAIAGLHEKPILATKCGRPWDEHREIYGDLTRSSIVAEAEASLKRLGVEAIDLYQIHWPLPPDGIEEAWRAIGDLIDAGKVRYGGVSNFNVGQLETIQTAHPVASLQPPYSLLERGVEDELLGFCLAHDIGVIAYSPMQKGLLTGKVTPEWVANLPQDDHRRGDPEFQSPRIEANMAFVQGISALARESGHSPAQLAIAWVLRRPEVTAAIVGARRPDQIDETAAAGDWSLDPSTVEQIDALLQQRSLALAE